MASSRSPRGFFFFFISTFVVYQLWEQERGNFTGVGANEWQNSESPRRFPRWHFQQRSLLLLRLTFPVTYHFCHPSSKRHFTFRYDEKACLPYVCLSSAFYECRILYRESIVSWITTVERKRIFPNVTADVPVFCLILHVSVFYQYLSTIRVLKISTEYCPTVWLSNIDKSRNSLYK